ncbi:MAG: PQQ-dependent catabolism-associated beta-propeller protein, partial [Methylomonas sp.]
TIIDINARKAVQKIKVGVEPEGVAASLDNRWVVSASETTNMLHWIDVKSRQIVENTLVDARPRAVAFTADSRELWATSEMAGTVQVLDADSRQILHVVKFAVPGVNAEQIQPVGVAIDKERRFAYIALGAANRVAVVNAQTYQVEKFFLVGQRVWNIAFSPDQKRLYTANGLSNDVSIIDLAERKVTKSVPVGREPWGLAVKP